MDQLILSTEVDNILPLLSAINGECRDVMSKLLCHYFFAPCGANDQLHLPLAVCQDECHYVQTVCNKQWGVVNHLLSAAGLSNVSCNATGSLLQGLAPCCIDAGIQIHFMITTTKTNPSTEISITTEKDLATEKGLATESSGMDVSMCITIVTFCLILISTGTETSLGLVIGLLAAFLIILIAAIFMTICLATVFARKRKATIRSLQLEVLTRSAIV